jgi:hypothetical protein
MSDALSDLARDQQRAEASREMWMAFGAFADAPSAERKQAALESAKNVDSISGGYWGGCTRHVLKTPGWLEGIEREDSGTWAILILQIAEFDPEYAERLQEKSPLKGMLVGAAEVHGGEVRLEGPAAVALGQSILQQVGKAKQSVIITLPKSASKIKCPDELTLHRSNSKLAESSQKRELQNRSGFFTKRGQQAATFSDAGFFESVHTSSRKAATECAFPVQRNFFTCSFGDLTGHALRTTPGLKFVSSSPGA